MKLTLQMSISAVSLLAALAIPARLAAQEQKPNLARYTVTDLGTLGGTFSNAYGANGARYVGGAAQLSGGNQHAFLWYRGHMRDLGTLGGPNSIGSGPDASNELAILSDTSTTDPLGEDFCGFGTHLICLGAIWKGGAMTSLPSLGGNNAEAFTVNNRGQLVGAAENKTQDANCPAPQVLDFEAVIWGPKPSEIHRLRPLPGDSVGFALGINDHGQAVGSSGSCANTTTNSVTGFVAGPHAVLWDNGRPTDLGSLGGTSVNTAAAINDRGEVIGGSYLKGDTTIHSFLWTKDAGMQDLGTLSGDALSLGGWINDKSQVVGWSCDSSGSCRAYLWENKVMTDLNSLIQSDSNLYLMFAYGIYDAGEIVGQAMEKSTGQLHAFLAIPRHSAASSKDTASAAQSDNSRRTEVPENVRDLQQRLRAGQFGSRLTGMR